MHLGEVLMSGAFTLIIALLVTALKGIWSINGRVKVLAQWKDDHEKSDDRQFKEMKEALASIWRRLST